MTHPRLFLLVVMLFTCGHVFAQNITKAEYFFNTDPGQGNGTNIPITPNTNVAFTTNIPVGSLPAGFHMLGMRVKQGGGIWSLFESRGFYISTTLPNVTNILKAEYFIDTEPGQGNGTPITVPGGANVNFVFSVPTTSLAAGFHFLAVRVRDVSGMWSVMEARGFYITTSLKDVAAIAAAEYFYDTDPGLGKGTALSVPSGNVSNFNVDLPIGSLAPGFHLLTIRIKDANGLWGQFEGRSFYVYPIAAASGDIVAAEYFIDSDPGQGLAIPAEVTTPALDINQVFPLQITGVSPGVHKLGFRVRDSEGVWSEAQLNDITILNCIKPSSPIAVSSGRCDPGTVELTAGGSVSGQDYKWYAQEFGGTALFTGDKFTTPSLTQTTDYYVSIFDPVTTCESDRVKATALFTAFNVPPAISVTGSATLCADAFTLLSAPSGFALYEWSNGATTQSIEVRDGGTYSVRVANGPDCFSPVSGTVTIIQTGQPCVGGGNPNNIPPDIEHASMSTAIRGKATLDLIQLISDHNGTNDIVLSSLRITSMPASGAKSAIDAAGLLTVDYNQIDFSGREFVTIQVCDLSASCTQQDIDITVAGDITPYNALSPNGDGMNESLYLEFIEIIPDTKTNKVTIFNRWGSPVFEMTDYNNNDRVFKGFDKSGNELPNGTYFYRVEFGSGKKTRDGFITLRR